MRSSRRTASMPSCISRASRRSARAAISRWPYYRNNLDSTLALLEEMAQAGCTRFVFSSSATVYGPDNAIPYVRDDAHLCRNEPLRLDEGHDRADPARLLHRNAGLHGRAAALLQPHRRTPLRPARRRSERHPEQSHALYRPRGGRSAGQADDLRRRLSHAGRHLPPRLSACRRSGQGPSQGHRLCHGAHGAEAFNWAPATP